MERNTTFDIMKGIGILLVIIGHSDLIVKNTDSIGPSSLIDSFHMPMFFIVCGFFSTNEQYGIRLLVTFVVLLFLIY